MCSSLIGPSARCVKSSDESFVVLGTPHRPFAVCMSFTDGLIEITLMNRLAIENFISVAIGKII